ncbi:hypothetical protein [Methylobacterium sp. WL7]|uniref:hypothetical protein n=1 Tax=Methylobacterium sp. WL7 TaxID=2603900 RepID=UPI0011C75E45|nr:hypothetical protein [Methylobacterium sp. WL7]TXN42370.1 hypothetical protein FV233_23055 [Methylobacterium sp. WL7]
MTIYNQGGAQSIAIAGSLLAEHLGRLLISKSIITKAEAEAIIRAAVADAGGATGQASRDAAPIIENVGRQWSKAADEAV